MPNVRITISQEVADEAEGQVLTDVAQGAHPTATVTSLYSTQLDLAAKRAKAAEAARMAAEKAAAELTAIDKFKTWLASEPSLDVRQKDAVAAAIDEAAGVAGGALNP